MVVMPAADVTDDLDVNDLLRRIDEAVHVHAFLDGYRASRHVDGRVLSASERARHVGYALCRKKIRGKGMTRA